MRRVITVIYFFAAMLSYGQQVHKVQDKQLTKPEVNTLIEEIVSLIESNYVDLEAGPKVIDALNKKVTSGEYDRLTTESEFVRVVNR